MVRESCRVYKEGQEIQLTGREYLLLAYFMENADKIISKERLYEQVWGEYSSICDNTIMVHIRHLREINQGTGQTIIMVTHSMEAAGSSTRMLTVQDGLIL